MGRRGIMRLMSGGGSWVFIRWVVRLVDGFGVGS